MFGPLPPSYDLKSKLQKSTTEEEDDTIMAGASARDLFLAAISTRAIYTKILGFFTRLHETGGLTAPPAVDILRDFSLAEKLHHADTSPEAAAAVAVALQNAAAQRLSTYNCTFPEIQLLLLATGGVISGSIVTGLVHTPFRSNDLDIFCPSGEGDRTVAFIRLAGNYLVTKQTSDYGGVDSIANVWWMTSLANGAKINVIESLTASPYDSIVLFHCTAVMAAWTALGLWVAYPDLTMSGAAIVTPATMPLGENDLKSHQDAWRILRKYRRRGFVFYLNEYGQTHTCGVALNCPATLRSTDDAGCLFTPFPSPVLEPFSGDGYATCWTLQGPGCSPGLLNEGRRSATRVADFRWAATLRAYIAMPTKPLDILQYW
ncbi:hypothetical protein C8R44DRAFT_893569 [Mycena epipterygia]|nr:hypothetical protein C8R44DRAFT_893569 [Mycena epipterygia]